HAGLIPVVRSEHLREFAAGVAAVFETHGAPRPTPACVTARCAYGGARSSVGSIGAAPTDPGARLAAIASRSDPNVPVPRSRNIKPAPPGERRTIIACK